MAKDVGNGKNAAASADPFYVFKDELESKVSAVHQKYAKWKTVLDAKESSLAKELPALTTQISNAIGSAENSLKFLEQTIVMVEANRSKFEHIDNAEIASRKVFVSATRKDLQKVSSEISSDTVKARIRKEEQKSIKHRTAPQKPTNREDDNARFLMEENERQKQIMKEQDKGLEDLSKAVGGLNHMAVEINDEVKKQNQMIDVLTDDVVETQERMNFVMDRMSKLLKTKDKCQIGLIIFLMLVLVCMVFLVIYT